MSLGHFTLNSFNPKFFKTFTSNKLTIILSLKLFVIFIPKSLKINDIQTFLFGSDDQTLPICPLPKV